MKKIVSLYFSLLMGIVGASAQDALVSGRVTDADDGSGLPGVNVVVKGTTIGTVTDIEGNYTLSVPEGAKTLVFSFMGMETQEQALSGRSTIDVAMGSEVEQLSEVVVTAAGIEANKRDLGYSIQNVDSDEILKARETNFVAALSGKVAGVQITNSSGTPGAAAQIRIRGNKSVQGSNSPLFVVDGVPIDNSTFNAADSPEDAVSNRGGGGATNSNRAIDINPEDVASISVLKGPAATVLYGIRAANGAVVITTKKGSLNTKAKIKYSFGYTIDEVNKLPDLQREYAQGSVQNGQPVFEAAMTGSSQPTSWGPAIADLRYADVETKWDRYGLIVNQNDPRATDRRVRAYNNAEDFFERGSNMTHNLSARGGTDKTSYFFSIGRLDQSGIIPNSSFDRTSFRATTTSELFDNFKATLSATYVRSGSKLVQNGSNTSGIMLGLLRTAPTFDNSAGYIFPEDGSQRAYRINARTNTSIYDNPYFTANKNFVTGEVNRLIGYTQLSYDPFPWLNITYRLGVDTYGDDRIFRNDVNSSSVQVGQVVNQTIRSADLNSDILVTFKKEFDKVGLNVTLGQNYFDKNVHINRIDGRGLVSPGFFNIASATSVNVSEGVTRRKLTGVFGTINLNYDYKVFLNVSGRNDWSSTLPEGNNSFFYPAVSLGWDVTNTFNVSSRAISYAKLRASWGQVGNDAPFAVTQNNFTQARARDGWTTPDGTIFPALGTNAFDTNTLLGNEELKAETTTTIEGGVDLQFLDGRIALDVTYFNALTRDAILNLVLASSSGWQQRVVNTGEIRNSGIEASLSARVVEKKDFSYEATLNFSRLRNKVLTLDGNDEDDKNLRIDPFGTQRIAEGQPFGVFYGTAFLRDEATGQMIINPSNGMPYEDPVQRFLGDPTPDFLLGFRNTFTYKGLTLSFLLDLRVGGDVYNGTSGVLNSFGVGAETRDRNERVVFPGLVGETRKVEEDGEEIDKIFATSTPNTKEVVKGGTDGGANYYSIYGFTGLTELRIEDGGWFRLRDISINYSLPSSLLAKTPFSAVDVGINARNLFLVTDYTGIDPETNLTGDSSNVLGYDYFNNPNTRSYGFNLNVTF